MIDSLLRRLAPYKPHLAPPSAGSDAEVIWYQKPDPGPLLRAQVEKHREQVVKALGGSGKKRRDDEKGRWIDVTVSDLSGKDD